MTGDSTMRQEVIYGSQTRPQRPPCQRTAMTFEKHWYFSRTDFRYDEWQCRICSRFSPNLNRTGIPVLFLKHEALEHEKTLDHQHCVEQFYKFLEDYPKLVERNWQCEMGWGPGQGDPLFPDQVYDQLTWNTPDVRKGVDFVNQFVSFWVEDVAAAFEESEPNENEGHSMSPADTERERRLSGREKYVSRVNVQKRHTRPTFEEFFEGIEVVQDTWGSPFENVYGEDGWGIAATPDAPEAGPEAGEIIPKNGPVDGDGWVVQQGRGRGKPSRGRGRGRGGRQRRAKANPSKVEGITPRIPQPAIQNLFTQLHVDD